MLILKREDFYFVQINERVGEMMDGWMNEQDGCHGWMDGRVTGVGVNRITLLLCDVRQMCSHLVIHA